MIGSRTRVYAVLGDPVAQSLSPAMHNAAFRALGVEAVYVALRVDRATAPAMIRALAVAGGGGNVTVPHKRLAASVVEHAGRKTVAGCNTFWGEGSRVLGTSTDEAGIRRGWEGLGRPPGDWLILGTGGSARAAAQAAADVGARVVIRSRDGGRGAALTAELATLGIGIGDPGAIGLVVNCTPLGLDRSDRLPLSVGEHPDGAAALDLVYQAKGTAWVRALGAAGHRAADGREVLLGQGAASFECWFPKLRAPIEVMGAALDQALR